MSWQQIFLTLLRAAKYFFKSLIVCSLVAGFFTVYAKIGLMFLPDVVLFLLTIIAIFVCIIFFVND